MTKAFSPTNPTFLWSGQSWRPARARGCLCSSLSSSRSLRRLREASGDLFPTCLAQGASAWPIPGGAPPSPEARGTQGFVESGGRGLSPCAGRNLPARSRRVAVSCAAAAASPGRKAPTRPRSRVRGRTFPSLGSWPKARRWGWGWGRAVGERSSGTRWLFVCLCVVPSSHTDFRPYAGRILGLLDGDKTAA